MGKSKESEVETGAVPTNASGGGLRGMAQGLLEAAGGKPVRVGAGVVSKLGLEFFVKGKPQTSWVSPLISIDAMVQGLMKAGHYNFTPAYAVEIEHEGARKELFLSTYHTKRAFGAAPDLTVGAIVDVHAVPSNSEAGFAFTYIPVRKVG
jgi:hypothetical protein